MPSGTRFVAKVEQTSFNLSVKQFDFLKKKTFKEPEDWRAFQSARGLIGRKLFVRRNGQLTRTKLGDQVLSAIATRLRKQPNGSRTAKESAK